MSEKPDSARLRAQTLTEIGRTHFNAGRFEAALASFEQAVAADATFLRARAGKANL